MFGLPSFLAVSLTDVNPGLVIWTLVTFVILLIVLSRVAWKPILKMVEERERSIRESVEAAAHQRDEAERLIKEHEASLAAAQREAAEMVRKTQAEVEKARAEAVDRAKAEAEDLVATARAQIAEEQKKAFAEVRTVAVELAMQAAAKLLEISMDEQKQRKLVQDYLASLPTDPESLKRESIV